MAQRTTTSTKALGMAALSIYESLILSLKERGLLDEVEASGILKDAANAHRNADSGGRDSAAHLDAAHLIESIYEGADPILRTRRSR